MTWREGGREGRFHSLAPSCHRWPCFSLETRRLPIADAPTNLGGEKTANMPTCFRESLAWQCWYSKRLIAPSWVPSEDQLFTTLFATYSRSSWKPYLPAGYSAHGVGLSSQGRYLPTSFIGKNNHICGQTEHDGAQSPTNKDLNAACDV